MLSAPASNTEVLIFPVLKTSLKTLFDHVSFFNPGPHNRTSTSSDMDRLLLIPSAIISGFLIKLASTFDGCVFR